MQQVKPKSQTHIYKTLSQVIPSVIGLKSVPFILRNRYSPPPSEGTAATISPFVEQI
jgi:hypothetical protein